MKALHVLLDAAAIIIALLAFFTLFALAAYAFNTLVKAL